jgi:ankyrin repeat protein
MTKSLPPRPDLAWLKKSAKERLAALRTDDPTAKLHEAQLDIAGEYGFASWRALKAHVDTVSLDGQIIAAAVAGNASEHARQLDEHPSKLSITGGQWRTPLLHLAAEAGHLDCVDLLMERGADPNQPDKLDHATPLHWAAQGGHLNVVRRLVDAGADIDAEGDAHEAGVIGWATSFHHVRQDVADYLLERGAKPTIFAAIALGRPELAERLIKSDTQALSRRMSKFEHSRTPLHFAVLKNQPKLVELMLRLGADPRAKDDRGNTPLNDATAKTDRRIIDALLTAGADRKEFNDNRFRSAVPILNVKNVPAAMAYYIDKLGFAKHWDWGSPPTFGCVMRDGVELFMCQGGQGARGTWISIFVQDVDLQFKEYRGRGAIIRQPPTNFPWGLREMNVEDLDGHRLRLGSEATGPADGAELGEGEAAGSES